MYARKNYAYGKQIDYFNSGDCIGWVRQGDAAHAGSGLVTLIADNQHGGSMRMFVGREHAGETWYDITGDNKETVVIDSDGCGTFSVKGRKNGKCYSVWVADNSKANTYIGTGKAHDKIKIYYKGQFQDDVRVVYGATRTDWTTLPGVQMTDSIYEGYKEITIDVKDGTQIEFCFTDSKGNWQNQDGTEFCNYIANSPGEYTVLNGKLIRDNPKI